MVPYNVPLLLPGKNFNLYVIIQEGFYVTYQFKRKYYSEVFCQFSVQLNEEQSQKLLEILGTEYQPPEEYC